MSKVYFSYWQGELIDNRGLKAEDCKDASAKFPIQYDVDITTKAFIGWDGFVLFEDGVDVVKLALNYARQYQEYSEACGRCTPGRWGGQILYDMLDKIARGEGLMSELDHIKEISLTMTTTSKCEIGKTVPVPILGMIEHFEEQFISLINEQKNHLGMIQKMKNILQM